MAEEESQRAIRLMNFVSEDQVIFLSNKPYAHLFKPILFSISLILELVFKVCAFFRWLLMYRVYVL